MKGLRATAILFFITLFNSNVWSYQWPSPQYDALEALLYENSLSGFVDGDQLRDGSSGSSIGAQWVRFAYHDSATHNVDDGTGGLDGSIFFELDSSENVGQGMRDTAFTFLGFSNKLVSRADVNALGLVHSVAGADGPLIPFRGGRIDATKAGPGGVPTPHQDIHSYLESFRKQGFNQADMIGLVACGHTLGTVRSKDFPDIVPSPPNDALPSGRVQFFDLSTPANGRDIKDLFDEKVVTGYLNGTTPNPLVIGQNVETRSDLRIFSSDNNVTMKSLADPQVFQSTCQTLLQRMIDTVPKDVKLTDRIWPLLSKIVDSRLLFVNNTLHFSASVRLATSVSVFKNLKTVRLCWCDKANGNCDRQGTHCAASGRQTPVSVSKYASKLDLSFTRFDFLAPIHPTTSLSTFWFDVVVGDSHSSRVISLKNSGGKNFVFEQDDVIFAKTLSKPVDLPNGNKFNFVVGVRDNLDVSRAFVAASADDMIPSPPQVDEPFDLKATNDPSSIAGYKFFSGPVNTKASRTTLDIHVELRDGRKINILNEDSSVGDILPPTSPVTNP